jgi:hypothetical protein
MQFLVGLATVQTFQQPSRASMITDAVPLGSLINAIGLNAIVFNVARTGGPAVAGVLIAVFAPPDSVQAIFFLSCDFLDFEAFAPSSAHRLVSLVTRMAADLSAGAS